ncbi:MAG: L,D-transpeptidase family protein [Bacteroidales bacterium]|nr:L,D-transpeptidase family protein [Bacteroidales bacterium]
MKLIPGSSPGDFFNFTALMRGSLIKKLIYIILISIFLGLLGWLFVALIPEPPLTELELASRGVSQARDNNSVIYSARLFREAQSYYDSAMISWRAENKRFILFRDYERVKMFAALSQKKAAEATKNTIVRANGMRLSLETETARLNAGIEAFEKVFLSLPLPQETVKKHARGKLLLREAEIDLDKGQYVSGNVKITEANEYITTSYAYARKILENYYTGYNRWQELVKATVNESRSTGSYTIVIEKIPGLCHVYHAGKKKYTFEAEFGSNWIGDKTNRGDMATPEGRYEVTKKLSGGSTKYHKALLINYPNKQDIEEFNYRVENGHLPADARIGGLIEIHGDGGKGGNWTEGCVALRNNDMDVVFRHSKTGTPVTIVGSTITLEEYLSSGK